MRITMTLDATSTASLAAFRQHIASELPKVVKAGERNALTMALAGANAGIYSTPPGKRPRTCLYRDSIGATSAMNGAEMIVEVFSSADYASWLEWGSVNPLTPPQAEQLAEALGDAPKPLYLGRSGEMWVRPNPAITRASYFGLFKMQRALGNLLAGVPVP